MSDIKTLSVDLKAAALKAKSDADEWGYDTDAFHDVATPDAVIELVEALEAAEKRIDELESSHNKLHEGMAAIYNAICANGASTSLSAILTFVKRAFEESKSAAAGIKLQIEE